MKKKMKSNNPGDLVKVGKIPAKKSAKPKASASKGSRKGDRGSGY